MTANLNYYVQGGQLYWAFSFSKASLVRGLVAVKT